MCPSLRACVYLFSCVFFCVHIFKFCAISLNELHEETTAEEKFYTPQLSRELAAYLGSPLLADTVLSTMTGTAVVADSVLMLAAICRSVFALNAVTVYLTTAVVSDSLVNFVAYREVKRYCVIDDLKVRKRRSFGDQIRSRVKMDSASRQASVMAELNRNSQYQNRSPPEIDEDDTDNATLSTTSQYKNHSKLINTSISDAIVQPPRPQNVSLPLADTDSSLPSLTGVFKSLSLDGIGVHGCDYIILDRSYPLPLAFVVWRVTCILSKIVTIALTMALSRRFRREDVSYIVTQAFTERPDTPLAVIGASPPVRSPSNLLPPS